MGGRNCGGQKEQNGEAAKEALSDDGAERCSAEPFHPAPRILPPNPHGEDDREKPDRARDQSMAVLVENSAHPHRRREREHRPAVRRWPVGHREPRIGARDEAAGQQQKDRTGCEELGEAVKHCWAGRAGALPA